jgi:hypothetical protein
MGIQEAQAKTRRSGGSGSGFGSATLLFGHPGSGSFHQILTVFSGLKLMLAKLNLINISLTKIDSNIHYDK